MPGLRVPGVLQWVSISGVASRLVMRT